MNFSRHKINAFVVDPRERWIFAGTLGGALLAIDLESLKVRHSQWLHSGQIEAVDVHPTLPYLATLGGDHTVAILAWDEDGLRPLHSVRLHEIAAENEYEFAAEGT